MSLLRATCLAAVLWTAPPLALAEELSVQQLAEVDLALERARKEVSKKYGDKPSSELTNEERASYIADEKAAVRAVFERLSVDPKAHGIRELRLKPREREALKEEKAALIAREEAARKAAAEEPPREPVEVQIVRGTSDENPVEVYRDDAAVSVERPNEDGLMEQPSEGGEATSVPSETEQNR